MAGCGKTILSSTIIQDLEKTVNLSVEEVQPLSVRENGSAGQKRVRDHDEEKAPKKKVKSREYACDGEALCELKDIHPRSDSQSWPKDPIYFYFDFNDTSKQSLENAIRSLVCQLYCKARGVQRELDALYESCQKGYSQPSMETLCTTLQSMIRQAGEVWIVLDALDECPNRTQKSNEGLLSWLERLMASQQTNVHLLVTSRPEHDIESAIGKWARKQDTIPIQGQLVTDDIRSYVHTWIKQLTRWESKREIQDEIETTLVEKADGMFRWVSCQLDALENCLDYPSLRKALQSLPSTLDETYVRILKNIPHEYKHHAQRLLQILAFSERPLEIDEAVDALAVDVEKKPHFEPKNRMPVPDEISKCCSSLVVVVTIQSNPRRLARKEIQLAHFSVKEYLISDRVDRTLLDRFSEDNARSSIAKVCLAYLDALDQVLPPGEIARRFPFAKYCARYWMKHARAGEQDDNLRSMAGSQHQRSW
ncbi:hypothetical protein SLS54_010390 [Diplodia seriata]